MKDYSEAFLRENWQFGRSSAEEVQKMLQFVLDSLFASKTVGIHDKVIQDSPHPEFPMDFEELLGALIAADHFVKSIQKEDSIFDQEYQDPCTFGHE